VTASAERLDHRVPEPELMAEPARARAYAAADFSEVNQGSVDRFRATFPDATKGRVVDLGCGPADIPLRLARALPGIEVTAVDGARAMLDHARGAATGSGLGRRVRLVAARVPALPFGALRFDACISNSLLHHLTDPIAARGLHRRGGAGAARGVRARAACLRSRQRASLGGGGTDNGRVEKGMIFEIDTSRKRETIDITERVREVLAALDRAIPEHAGWLHDRIDDNAQAHILASILGPSEIVPIENGELRLGRWQALMLVELDGPRRSRRVMVTLTRAEAV
jgi:thiamine phosphate synthase YjbQ (UPF0047 family)